MNTLIDLLLERAQKYTDTPLYHYINGDNGPLQTLTYKTLTTEVSALGALLTGYRLKGKRVLLCYPSGMHYITAFWSCLYAGVVAVPVYPPRKNQSADRLLQIIRDAGAAAVLTSTQVWKDIKERLEPAIIDSLEWIVTDQTEKNNAVGWSPAKLSPEDVAFLQYTSGSTGNPKGVMISHLNILRNQELLFKAFGRRSEPTVVGWLPLYHDMGLIGNMLYPLYAGGTLYLMSPADFLQRPLRWLKAISDFKADISGGPNFAYERCLQRIPPEQRSSLDLSHWEVAFNGAEMVNAATIERFSSAFAPCGFKKKAFYPCYGMAEATLLISGGRRDEEPRVYRADPALLAQHKLQLVSNAVEGVPVLQLVSCGRPEVRSLRIVDPITQQELPHGMIGEVWVNDPAVAQGYWNNDQQQAFKGLLKEGPSVHFLRTGDLGFLLDGELCITGRLKELMIIRGQNIYPQDVERVMEQAHEALQDGAGCAFSVTAATEEKLVLIQELKRSHYRNPDIPDILAAIRSAVTRQFDLSVHAIWLISPGTLLKTSSGKIQRNACKQAFLTDQQTILKVIAAWSASSTVAIPDTATTQITQLHVQPEAVLLQLRTVIAAHAKIPLALVDAQDALDKFGLDSVAVAEIAEELGNWAGINISPAVLYDYPDIPSLASWLHNSMMNKERTPINIRSASPAIPADMNIPVAVIGIGCRFPGAADADALWELLQAGRSAIRTVPAGRWPSLDPALYKKYPYISQGGFLDHIDEFDAAFFGISDREAERMDPQQRGLLEITWAAFEDAGIAPARWAGRQVGVFTGISSVDYLRLQQNINALDAHSGTGNAGSIAANRLSYFFDFKGPSWSVDTACSSSLVAIIQACKSLQQQECGLAIAAGANIMAAPDLSLIFAKAGMLSPDGACKTFDAAANGYVRGEGYAAVLLKRLPDALRDGDNIYGVIKGYAVNQDGHTNGLTAPNGPAQEAVINAALRAAGKSAAQLDFVEAHGTGTSLGDPIEINGLANVLQGSRTPDKPCYLTAVKANIGHLEAAAGIAGFIKTLLCLQHRQLVPQLHFKNLNPQIRQTSLPLQISGEAVSLQAYPFPLTAGISAFGFGGTNAHVIIEEAPAPVTANHASAGPALLLLSAVDEATLPALAERTSELVRTTGNDLHDITGTYLHGRSHLRHRAAWVAADKGALLSKLQEYTQDHTAVNRITAPRLAMLFTGQGAQYAAMGHGLYQQQRVFRESMEECSAYLQASTGISLIDLLYNQKDDQQINQTAITQPLLFSLEVSMARLWESWGIRPHAVMGHSVGEIAAACVAGVFSLQDGLQLIATRGALMQSLPAGGEMWALMASAEQVVPLLQGYEAHISIASINAPNQVVIAGAGDQLQRLLPLLQSKKINSNPLKVSHAFHSPLMQPIIETFRTQLQGITFHLPRIPLLSNVSGTWAGQEITSPEYWAQHILAPVRFSQSIQALKQEGYNIFLETGPHPVLNNLARQTLGLSNDILLLPSIVNKSDNNTDILQSLAALYTQGFDIRPDGIAPASSFNRIKLPAYPFRRDRYWLNTTANAQRNGQPADETIWQRLSTDALGSGMFSPEEKLLVPGLLHKLQRMLHQDGQAKSYGQHWIAGKPIAASSDREASLLLIAEDEQTLTALLATERVQQARLSLLIPESLGEILPPLAPQHQVYYYKTTATYRSVLESLLQTGKDVTILAPLGWTAPADINAAIAEQQGHRLLILLQVLSALSVDGNTYRLVGLLPTYIATLTPPAIYPYAAVYAAMMKCAALELPEVKIKALSVDTQPAVNWQQLLNNELQLSAFDEQEVVMHDGKRYICRLREQQVSHTTPFVLDPARTVIVTGGSSALAVSLLPWIWSKGGRKVLLVCRNKPEAAKAAVFVGLQAPADAVTTWCYTDIADKGSVALLQAALQESGQEPGAIFHLAGVLKDKLLHQLEWEEVRDTWAAKISGTDNLHVLSQQYPSAAIICFSSVAAVLGAPSQLGYAAANAYMDAFVAYRRQQGLPGISINWGPWEGEGMAAGTSFSGEGALLHKLSRPEALLFLDQLLSAGDTGQVILSLQQEALGRYSTQLPILRELINTPTPRKQTEDRSAGIAFKEQLLTFPPAEQQRQLQQLVSQTAASVLGGQNSKKEVNPLTPFVELGMNSIMNVELQQRLEQALDLNFSAVAVYNHNTVTALAEFLLNKIIAGASNNRQAPVQYRPDSIDTLDDASVTALLEKVLSNKKYAL